MNYKIETITTEQQFLNKETEWLEFENKINDISITYSYNYLLLFWQSFKDDTSQNELGIARQLLILFLYKDNELLAIFPFCKIRRKRKKIFHVHSIEFIGQQFFSNYSDIITNGITNKEFEIAKKWLYKNIKFDFIFLSHIPDFTKNKKIVYNNNLYPFSISSEAILSKDQTYLQYKKDTYSSNYLQNIRTLHNRINKHGIKTNIYYKLFETTDIDEIQKLAESKKDSGKKNIYNLPQNKTFLNQLYKKFNAKICFLCFDKTKIAYLINLKYKHQSFWYDISFDREYKQYWPGTLVFDYCLEESFSQKELHVYLGWGIDFIKNRFCNQFVEISNFVLQGNSLLSKIWYEKKKLNCQKATKIFKEKINNSQHFKD